MFKKINTVFASYFIVVWSATNTILNKKEPKRWQKMTLFGFKIDKFLHILFFANLKSPLKKLFVKLRFIICYLLAIASRYCHPTNASVRNRAIT